MDGKNDYHIHVEGGTSPLALNLRDLWYYRDLVILFTKRTITLMYKQTVLGPLWLILHPLMTSVVYAAVFKGVAGLSTDGVPALLFYLTSHSLWNFFASSLKKNANTFVQNANIFGKVYFPRLTISISAMFTALFEFAVELLMIAILLAYHVMRGEVVPNWSFVWILPFVLLQVGVLGLGIGILISSLTTKYRDLTFVVDFGISLWMYVSPVVYPLSQLESGSLLYRVYLMNPMVMPLELLRFVLLGQGTLPLPMIVSSVLVTVFAMTVGLLCFNRVERSFIDTI
ncbi:MAG: ABC transporter permease [Blautia sp.]|nr:ABC transporter permease [Blautia sp.]